jgi:leucyl-tRNA---protein transferase
MLLDADFEFIHEEFEAARATPVQLDMLLANGWRHFGTHFFRYNLGIVGNEIRLVTPLRIRLSDFSFSKSQRRVLRENADLDVRIEPLKIDNAAEELFHRHKRRFDHHTPDSIYEFLSGSAETSPCETKQIRVFEGDDPIAVSYFDVGERSCSGVYAIFEPAHSERRLGIYTMLKEIEFTVAEGKEFYYQGYAYQGDSFYDYKKKFRGTELFDWKGNWRFLNAEIAEAGRWER